MTHFQGNVRKSNDEKLDFPVADVTQPNSNAFNFPGRWGKRAGTLKSQTWSEEKQNPANNSESINILFHVCSHRGDIRQKTKTYNYYLY